MVQGTTAEHIHSTETGPHSPPIMSCNLKPKGTTSLSLVSRCQPSLIHQMPGTLWSIPAVTIPVNGHWTLDDRDVQFFLKHKWQSLKFHYPLWLWPQQVQATVGHQRSYRCT